LEFGLEVGFYQGIVEALRQNDWNDRVRKSIDKVQEAIDDFPTVNQVFARAENDAMSRITMNVTNSVLDEGDNDSEDITKLDILNKLQRIRARFKLLTVQLGKPHFSLQSTLEQKSVEHHESTDDGW